MGPGSYFISWVIALLYEVTGRSLLLAQSLSIFLGTATVLFGWYLVRESWGERIAINAGWAFVFLPTLILCTTISMRAAYVRFLWR
jgi:hypothetical protein